MKYSVIGYDNQVLGQVDAANQMEAWEEAGKMYNQVLDVRPAEVKQWFFVIPYAIDGSPYSWYRTESEVEATEVVADYKKHPEYFPAGIEQIAIFVSRPDNPELPNTAIDPILIWRPTV